jgi:hypothetical protein
MNIVQRNIGRLILLFFFQVLVLKRIIVFDNFNYISILIYPFFLMMLPINTPNWLLVIIGFGMGISLDVFYDSLGVHAAACTFSVFARSMILELIKPKNGYPENVGLTRKRYGIGWFLSYLSIFLFVHMLFYFSVEAFTFVYWKEILIKTFSSFLISFIIILIYQFIFDPTD